MNLKWIFVIAGLVFAGAGGWAWRMQQVPLSSPSLPIQDLNQNKQAGMVDRAVGEVYLRPLQADDQDLRKLSSVPKRNGTLSDSWQEVLPGDVFPLKTLFRLHSSGSVQATTHGSWIVALEGEGEFAIEEARTNPARTTHATSWFLKRGNFRAKPQDYDPSEHWLQLRTPSARIIVQKGEIGVNVREDGTGQVWLLSGRAMVEWNDGRRKRLKVKGMDYL